MLDVQLTKIISLNGYQVRISCVALLRTNNSDKICSLLWIWLLLLLLLFGGRFYFHSLSLLPSLSRISFSVTNHKHFEWNWEIDINAHRPLEESVPLAVAIECRDEIAMMTEWNVLQSEVQHQFFFAIFSVRFVVDILLNWPYQWSFRINC